MALPVPPALVAVKDIVEVATADGVPEMTPVPVFTDNPEGKFVALKLVGEFDPVIV